MKQETLWIGLLLMFLLMALAMVGLLAQKGVIGPVTTPTPTAWTPPVVRGQPSTPTPTPGWWASPPDWLGTFTPSPTVTPTKEGKP